MPHSDSDSPPPASHLVRQPLPSQAAPAPPADRSYLFTRRALSSLSQVELDDRLILATRVTTPHFDHAACVRAALARGARPNACSPDGNSALHWACWSDLPHVVRLLLRAGADSGRRNHTGETPAMWASISGSVPCLVLLAEADASRARAGVVASCEEASAERERVRVQKRQARATASVGPALPPPVTSAHGPVPMSSSSGEVSEDESDYWEETSTISTLLSSSAASSRDSFVLDRCSNGFTCLHLASRYVKRPAADYLLSLGADIDSRDSDGRTPLHHACAFNHVPMAELLCTRGASPLARDAGGNTPLHVLAATGDFRELATAVMRFYNFAPAAAAKNDEGRTPAEVARLAGFGRLAAVIAKHDPTLKGRLDRWAHRVCSDPETGKDASMLWLGRWLLGCICLWLLLHMLVFTPAFHAQRAADAGKRAALSAATAAVAAAEKAATAGSMDHLTLAALAAAAADAASTAAAASVGGLTFWTVLFWLGGLGTVAAWLQCHYADPGVILPAPMMVRAVHTTAGEERPGGPSVSSLDGGEDDGGGDEEMRVGNRPSHVSPAPSLVADPVYLSLLAPPTPFPAHASGTDSVSVPLWPLSVSAMARALVRLPHLPPAALGRLMQLYKTGWVRRSSFIPPSSAPVAAVGIPLLPLQAVPASSLYSLSTAPVVLPAAVTGLPRSPAGRARAGVSLTGQSTQAPGRPSPQSVPPALHVMLTAHSCAFPRVKSPATPARKEPLPLVSGELQDELLAGALPRAAALAVALMSSPARARAALLSAQGPDVAAALVAVAAAVAGQDSLSSDSRPSDAGMHSAAVTLTAALSEGGGDCGQLIVPSLATALLRPTVADTALAPPSFAPAAVVRGLAWVRTRAPWLRPLLPEPAPAQASVASSVWSSFAGTKGSAEGNAWGVETSTTVWTPSGVANPSLPLRVTPPHLPFSSQLPRAWVSPILSEHPPSFLIVLGQLLFPSAWAHPSAAAPAPLSLPHTPCAHGPAHKVGDGLDRAMRSAAASAAAATASAVGAVGAGWSKLSGGAAGRGKVEPPVGVSLGARRGVENEDEDDDIEAQRGAADVNDTDVEDGPRDGGKRPLLAVSSATATATARSEPVGSISSPLPVSTTPEDALASLFSTGDPVTDAAIGALLASLLSPAPRSHSTDDDDLDAEDHGHSTEAGGSWLSQPTPTRGRSEGFLPPLPPYGAEVEDTGPAGQRARMGPSVSSSRRMSGDDDSSDDDDSTQSSVRAPARSLCPAAATADKLLSLAAAPDTVAVAVLAAELERSLSRLLLPPSTHRAYSSPSAASSSSTGYGITAAAAVRALASPGLARLSPWLPSHPYAAPAPALHPAPGSARDGQGGARIVLGPGMSQGGPLLLPAERRPRVATVVCEANTGTDAPLPAPVAGTGGGGALLSVPPVRLAPLSTPGPTAWSVTVAAIAEAVYKAVVRTRRALRPRLPLTPPPTATTGPVCSGAALLWAGSESRPRQIASAAATKALATAIAAAVCTRVAAGAGKALAVPLPEGLGLLTPSPAATTNTSSVNTHHFVSRTASLTPAAAASVAFSASSTVAVTAAQGGDIAGRGTVSMSNLLPPATAAAAAAAAVHSLGKRTSPQDGCALGWGDRLALATELRGAILSVLASLTTVRIGAAAAAGAQWRLRDAVAPPSGAPSRTNEAKPRAAGGAQWLEPVPAPGQRRTRIGAASFIGTAAAHSRRSSDDADAAGEWASAGGLTLIDADRDADADAAVTSGGATSGSSSVMRGLPVGNTAAAEARWLRVVNDAIVEMSHGMAPAARAEEAAKELGVSFSQVNPRVVASTLSSAATLSVAASKEGYSRVGSSAPASASDDAPGETVALEDDTASSSIHDYLAGSSSFRMPPPPAVVPTPAATTASADACCAPALTSASSPWESAARYLVLQPLGVHHTSSVCVTCRVAKPLRARHCRRCNRCVYRQDHHCPWVDTCVGGHNYRSFVLFCTLGSILSWSFVGCALSYIMSPGLLFPSLSLDSGTSSASTALADAAARGSAPTPPPRSSIPGYIDAAASAAGLSSVGRLALAAAVAVASGSEPVYGGWATLWGMGGMVTAACTVHAAFMALFVSILWISHLYMVSVNCTTQEQFSTPPYLIHFDKGFLRNWINFLRGPMHEPLLFAQPTVAPHVKALSQPDSSAALLSPLDKARHHPRGDSDSDSDSDSHRRRSRSGRGPAPPPLALALAAAAADSGEFGYSDDDAYDALGAETAVASPSALSSTTVGRADDAPVPYDTERAPRSIVSSSGVMGDRDRYYAMGGVAGAWQPPQSSQQPAPAAVPAPAPAAAAPAPAAARSAFPPMPSFAPLGQIPVAGTALRAPSANAAAPSAAAKTL